MGGPAVWGRSVTPGSTVGVIVNPVAGKDVRRLSAGVGHTPDTLKIGIVRRVVAAAVETGVERVVVNDDTHRLAPRAIADLALGGTSVEVLDDRVTGDRADTVAAAAAMAARSCGALVALGGDGTCRDVTLGWPDVPLVAISTGTNNVFPEPLDGTSAGTAAALVATGGVDPLLVTRRSKRIVLRSEDPASSWEEIALIDVAVIHTDFVGARAVRDARSIRLVLATIGDPTATGLSAVAGRIHPLDADEPGGVLVELATASPDDRPQDESPPDEPTNDGTPGTGSTRERALGPTIRRVRVPLLPGSFDTVHVSRIRHVVDGASVPIVGPGVLALDGERHVRLGPDDRVTAFVDRHGPRRIDVGRTLRIAARRRRFDQRPGTYTDARSAPGDTSTDPRHSPRSAAPARPSASSDLRSPARADVPSRPETPRPEVSHAN